MKTSLNFREKCSYLLCVGILGRAAMAVQAQEKYEKRDFCGNNWNWSDGKHVSASNSVEKTMPAVAGLNVYGKRNGGISVKGENRSDIAVRACVQAWAESEEAAQNILKNVRIETGANIFAENAVNENNWSVSYEIRVPVQTNLNLTAYNGGIAISSVEGKPEFTTKNGGLMLKNLAGDVKGRTTNGGIMLDLTANAWKGSGLDLQTTNGGIIISMSENYAARLETGTVNGGFNSEIQALQIEKKQGEYYQRNKRISTDLNGGGATLRVMTTNGGVKIKKR